MSLLLARIRQSQVVPPALVASYSGGSLAYLNPRRYRIEDDDEREELRKEIIKIGKATPQEVVTGIVDIPRRKRSANTDAIDLLSASRRDAEMARIERIRRIVAADDDWLMLS